MNADLRETRIVIRDSSGRVDTATCRIYFQGPGRALGIRNAAISLAHEAGASRGRCGYGVEDRGSREWLGSFEVAS
jgi:hypothetical protein